MILLTTFYLDADPRRRAEFIECVRRNARNQSIDQIHILVESPAGHTQLVASYPPLGLPHVTLITHAKRVTYHELFTYANRHLSGQRVIIANADIFFDQSLERLDGYPLAGKLLCLSRWNVDADGRSHFFNHPASQDAWIFEAPIREFPCGFHLGVPGCDNRLAWEAQHAGLQLSNPSRSIRAQHLHLTQVHRYTQHDRIAGATASIPATFLGTPWLWFVVPCKGRLDDLRNTMPSILGQPHSSYVLVDYGCPDQAGVWTRDNHPRAIVVPCDTAGPFRGAEARNRGAAVVDDDGVLCFLDADVTAAPEFSRHVLSNLPSGSFLVPGSEGSGLSTALVCRKADFDRAGGFDETFLGWGQEVLDLRDSFRRMGLIERNFPTSLLSRGVRHCDPAARQTALAIHASYRRAKNAILDEIAGRPVSRATLREIYRAIARRLGGETLAESGCASVAFRESMGYTIARLDPGASSHNNEQRPVATIPDALKGRFFTQVVARVTSPIDVEFLAAGKLYIAVGTDWDGYKTATAWLREAGQHEAMPLIQTRRGTSFEVWSLVGEAGDKVTLPTQVMLVADHLVRA